jgi:tetratricopeptide (TPR) repeat protein
MTAQAKLVGLFGGLVVWVVLVFSNSLHNQFMIDDHSFFVNPHVNSHVSREISQYDSTASSSISSTSLISLRLTSRIFRSWLYQTFGPAVEPYHAANLILLCLFAFSSAFLVYLVSGNMWAGFAASALFCVHPINAVVVDYITGHEIIFYGLFANLTLICSLLFQKDKRILYQGISVLCLTAALLSHELAIMLPIYQMVILKYLEGKEYRSNRYVRYIGFHIMIILFYLAWRLYGMSLPVSLTNVAYFSDLSGFLNDVAASGILLIWYLGKLIFPYGIVLIWSLDPAEMTLSLNLLGGFFLICLGVGGWMLLRLRSDLSRLALVWFFIGFLPLPFIFLVYPAMGPVIEPHWFFFSVQGFFLWVILLIDRLSHARIPRLKVIIMVALMALLSANTYLYNRLWRDEKTYCHYWLSQSPHNRPIHFWLANAYIQEGLWSKAGEHLKRSLVNRFMDWEVYNNLGLISMKQHNWQTALSYFQQALAVNPQSGMVFNNLGLVYHHLHQDQQAESFFQKAIDLDPQLIPPRLNLADMSVAAGRKDKAYQWHQEILALNPHEIHSQLFLLEYYGSQRSPQTETIAGKLYRLLSAEHTPLCIDAANILAFYQYPSWATKFYEKAMNFNPKDARVHLELGKFYANYHRFDLAIETWRKGQILNPQENGFQPLILEAQALMGSSR